MKKILLFSSLLLGSLNVMAQISTTETQIKTQSVATSYDSLSNFLGSNAKLYKGQVLYLKGKSKSLQTSGYRNFYVDYKADYLSDKSNVYQCCSGLNSNYEALAGKYYEVLDVYRHPKLNENEFLYGRKHYLKLKHKETNDILYYEYDEKYEHNFPFIVVGYYEKQSQLHKGSKYVLTATCLKDSKNINTGDSIAFNALDVWTCNEVTIDVSKHILSFKLMNTEGIETLVSAERCTGKWSLGNVYTIEQANKYKESFGEENWNKILSGKVQIGFTSEMVKLSWGKPKKINKASYGNQWVYEGQYLYFENDVLKSFN